MSQCVPNWDLDDPPNPSSHLLPSSSVPLAPLYVNVTVPDKTGHLFAESTGGNPNELFFRLNYEVTELTWENGQLLEHGLGYPRVNKPIPKYPSSETLEAIVNQAKLLIPSPSWLLPAKPHNVLVGPRTAPPSAIESCNGAAGKKRARVAEGGGSGSLDSTRVTDLDTFGTEDDFVGGGGGTGSPDTENTSFGGGGAGSKLLIAADDHDSACHSPRSPSQSQARSLN